MKLKEKVKKFIEKHNAQTCYFQYTVIFLIISLCIFGIFVLNGKSFVYGSLNGAVDQDGLTQHFNSLVYYRNSLRDFLEKIWSDRIFDWKMWDMNIGLGSDILTTLHYYVIGDPLNLFSVLVPVKYMEQFYNIMIVIRIYLAGLSYCYYCKTWDKENISVLTGSVVYSFCGYVFAGVLKHPFFGNPMIYLPLVFCGVDKILKGKKPWLYIGTIILSAVSSFYFFYMICIFTFLYGMFRYIWIYKKVEVVLAVKYLLWFMGYTAIGIAIASPILLPNIAALFESSRTGAEKYVPLLYESSYYQKAITGFISGYSGYWLCLGFSAVSIVAILTLFIQKGKRELKAAFILLTLFACIPWIGHALNGFSYVTNRWIWAYGMLVAYIVTTQMEEVEKLSEKERKILVVLIAAYSMTGILNQMARTKKGISGVVLLCIMMLLFLINSNHKEAGAKVRKIFLFMTGVGVCVNGMYYFSTLEENRTNAYIDSGKVLESIQQIATNKITVIRDEIPGRFDQYKVTDYYNSTLLSGKSGTSFFFSLGSPYIGKFFDEMGLNAYLDYAYNDLDGRAALDGIFSVGYFMVRNGETQYVPYGYSENLVYEDGECRIFKADTSLPLGYMYENYIDRDIYDKMSITQKQQVILQGAVLDKNASVKEGTVPAEEIVLNDQSIEYEIEASEGITVGNGSIQVTEPGTVATIVFDGKSDCETYVVWDNLKYTSVTPSDIYGTEEFQNLSTYEKKVLRDQYRHWEPETEIGIDIINGSVRKRLIALTEYSIFYLGKEDFLVNVGYSQQGRSRIKLKFDKPGVYAYDELSVVCQPVKTLSRHLERLKKNGLQDIQIETNAVTGRSNLPEAGIACMSVPYSRGWKVYVDGEQKEVLCVNTMFLGVELSGGEHNIRFEYETPYLKAGMLCSLLGILSLAGVLVKGTLEKRKQK